MRFNLIEPAKGVARLFSHFPASGYRSEYEMSEIKAMDLETVFAGRGLILERGYQGPDADIFADDHSEIKFHRIQYSDRNRWYFYSEEDRSTFDRYCEQIADSKFAAQCADD